ncbi:ADP-ribosylglycohydrolase family protein [Paenibacillus sp. FSL L8-0709]|uniref:ADP-ribosylglycohydrolase family protein n=1 Tax=Paenibacillus sp. FSL L8-0709 TaxID=2975312 RepID=UPI0030FBDACB
MKKCGFNLFRKHIVSTEKDVHKEIGMIDDASNQKPNKIDQIFDAIMGSCIGDALGVPVEFMNRISLQAKPIRGLTGYGT